MIRLTTVAMLLATAVVALWAGPEGCAPRPDTPAAPSRSAAPVGPVPPARPATLPEPPATAAHPGSGPESLAVPPGLVGVPVRLAEQVAAGLLRPGDRVSLFTVGVSSGSASPIADDAVVLAVTVAGDLGTEGGLLVALRPVEAKRVLGTPPRTAFAVAVTSSR